MLAAARAVSAGELDRFEMGLLAVDVTTHGVGHERRQSARRDFRREERGHTDAQREEPPTQHHANRWRLCGACGLRRLHQYRWRTHL